jgi:hypothetical protein
MQTFTMNRFAGRATVALTLDQLGVIEAMMREGLPTIPSETGWKPDRR